MLFVLAFVAVDLVLLGFLSAYVGGREQAVLVPNKEGPRYEDEVRKDGSLWNSH